MDQEGEMKIEQPNLATIEEATKLAEDVNDILLQVRDLFHERGLFVMFTMQLVAPTKEGKVVSEVGVVHNCNRFQRATDLCGMLHKMSGVSLQKVLDQIDPLILLEGTLNMIRNMGGKDLDEKSDVTPDTLFKKEENGDGKCEPEH
jgi:hypothetical protein